MNVDELVPDISDQQKQPVEQPVQPEEQAPPEEMNLPAYHVNYKYYGPAVGDEVRPSTTMNAHGGRLRPGDVAVSPDLLDRFPMGSYVAFQTKNGVEHGRVTDLSGVGTNPDGSITWNHNTIETWNRTPGMDSGHATPLTEDQLRQVMRMNAANPPERAKLAGDQPTAASIENAMPAGAGQAPDITNPDTGAPDVSGVAPADVQDIADQVTENLQAQQPAAKDEGETAPMPTDPSKMQYDPEHDMVSWDFNGKRWYVARGMTKPAELKAPVSHRKIITDPATQSQWSIDPDHPEDAKPLNLPGNPAEVDISKIKEGDWNSVPEALRGQAQLYASYRGPKVSGFALAKPYFNKLFAIIAKVDPTFNQQNYDARQKTMVDFSSAGKSGQNITSFNTAMDHLGNAMQNSDAMADAMKQGKSPFLNQMHLWGSALTGRGRDEINAYSSDVAALQNEVERATSGAAPHVAGKEAWEKILDPSQPPSARIAGMAEQASLMGARLEENKQAYKRAFGGQEPNFSFMSPEAEKTMQEVIKRLPEKSPTRAKVQNILNSYGSNNGSRPYVDPQSMQGPQNKAELTSEPSQTASPADPYGGRQTVRRINPDQSDPSKSYIIYDAATRKPLGYEP